MRRAGRIAWACGCGSCRARGRAGRWAPRRRRRTTSASARPAWPRDSEDAMSGTPALPAGYEVMRLLGQGAFGAVYQARQIALDRLVAVKMVRDASGLDVGRFLREGQAVSKLRHPAIVQVYAVDTAPETG